jgi:UMF1 family MFS transporter
MEGCAMRPAVAWAFYDWANSAFATTVIAGFFPLFFKQYWSAGTDATVSTFQLGAANSLASILVALCAPILGAIADRGGNKKIFLLAFAALGITMTAGLFAVAPGAWQAAIVLFVLATIGFSGSNVFYDALLVDVAIVCRRHSVSAFGFALGYLGGGLLFALNVVMILTPQTFGLVNTNSAVRLAFVVVAVWWAIFSIPLAVWVREPSVHKRHLNWASAIAAWRQLQATFREVRSLRVVVLFLVAYWLYIDGVGTIIRMAVDYGMSLGLEPKSLMVALLMTQFVGFPAALLFGKIGNRYGAKAGILLGLSAYIGVAIWGFFMQHEAEFYGLAVVIGCVQGGVQALSRSLYSRLIPQHQAGAFFGFYNMLGKFAAVIGPVLMGWVAMYAGNPRYGILSVIGLLAVGAILLLWVDEAAAA